MRCNKHKTIYMYYRVRQIFSLYVSHTCKAVWEMYTETIVFVEKKEGFSNDYFLLSSNAMINVKIVKK